jgi:hypothetical protein
LIDTEGFAYYMTHLNDDTGYYEHELKKENRRNNFRGDINYRYNNYNNYKETTLARYVEKAVNLLPTNGTEIRVKDLKQSLINLYNLDNNFANRVVRELGSNDRRVKARSHSYNKSVDEIRLHRLD